MSAGVPLDRFYSHLSVSHKSGSHIDLAFGSRLFAIRGASYLPAGISYHSPMKITVQIGVGRSPGVWCLDSKWVHNGSVQELKQDSGPLFWKVNESTASPQLVWDAFKAFTHGQFISAIKTARVKYNSQLSLLEHAESDKASRFVTSLLGDKYSSLAQARRDLELHLPHSC